jgi:two-component system, chemotaxis family, chemotaxis protein CheY
MKTLIAEDDLASRLLMQKILSPYGECDIAVNGREAVEAFRLATLDGDPYELVCLDVMMPEMDGHEVLRAIRAAEEAEGIRIGDGAKVIMTTALNDKANVFGAFREMCEGYLIKPINRAKLLSLLAALELVA